MESSQTGKRRDSQHPMPVEDGAVNLAAPLSWSELLKTGSFASPPHGGFALYRSPRTMRDTNLQKRDALLLVRGRNRHVPPPDMSRRRPCCRHSRPRSPLSTSAVMRKSPPRSTPGNYHKVGECKTRRAVVRMVAMRANTRMRGIFAGCLSATDRVSAIGDTRRVLSTTTPARAGRR